MGSQPYPSNSRASEMIPVQLTANNEKDAKLNNNTLSSVWRLLAPHLEWIFFEFKLSRRVLVWLLFIGFCVLMGYGYGSGELEGDVY